MNAIERIARDVLIEAVDDWSPIERVIYPARESAEAEGLDFRVIVRQVLEHLFQNDLAEAGRIGDEYVAEGNSPEVLERVIKDCESYDWAPFGAGYWLLGTKKGIGLGKQYLREMGYDV